MNRHSSTESAMESATEKSGTLGKWISGIALGALAMYLTDPDRGRRRRAVMKDKMQSLVTRTSDAVDVASRDLSNRMQGMRAQAGRMLARRQMEADGELLAARVRSRIGRATSHPHAIKIHAEQGCVTVSGPILAAEKDQLISAVSSTPGVMSVDDALEVHDRPDVSGLQGSGRQRRSRPTMMQENWPPALRAIATLGGGALGFYGLKRRSAGSTMLAAVGLGLLARGMTNMPLSRLAGSVGANAGAGRQGIHLHKAIHVDASPETVFDQWSRYENFPHFMSHVQSVTDLGNGHSHWTVTGPAGAQVEWDAVLTESRRPEELAWTSDQNATVQHTGRVRFEPDQDGTRVSVDMSYMPPAGAVGHAVASMFSSSPKKMLDDDLMRMKSFIEGGTQPHDAAQRAPQQTAQAPSSTLH